MWERHYEIMRRLISGDRPCDIAASFNMTDTRMSIIVNSPLFQARLLEMRERANAGAADVMQRITRLYRCDTILECARNKRGDRVDLKYGKFCGAGPLDRRHGYTKRASNLGSPVDIETIRKRRDERLSQPSSVAALVGVT
jgi:hypothetical protein